MSVRRLRQSSKTPVIMLTAKDDELIDEVLKETILIDSMHSISSEINEIIMVNGNRG